MVLFALSRVTWIPKIHETSPRILILYLVLKAFSICCMSASNGPRDDNSVVYVDRNIHDAESRLFDVARMIEVASLKIQLYEGQVQILIPRSRSLF